MVQARPFILGLCVAIGTIAVHSTTVLGDPGPRKGEPGDAMAILKKAEAALKDVKFAKYEAEYNVVGWATAFVPNIIGSATLGEPAEHDVPRFRSEAKLTPPGSTDAVKAQIGCDGDVYYLVDHRKKMVYADMDDAVLGTQQRNFQRLLLPDFVAEEPLADDLKAESVERKEETNVGGEACYQVHVTRSETQAVTWHISKKDYLPRKVDRFYKDPERGETSTHLVMTKLVTSSKCDVGAFKLTVPKGFTKTDEFAP